MPFHAMSEVHRPFHAMSVPVGYSMLTLITVRKLNVSTYSQTQSTQGGAYSSAYKKTQANA